MKRSNAAKLAAVKVELHAALEARELEEQERAASVRNDGVVYRDEYSYFPNPDVEAAVTALRKGRASVEAAVNELLKGKS